MCLNKQFPPSYSLCQCRSLSPGPHLRKASDWLLSYTPKSHRFTFKDKYLTLQTMTASFFLAIWPGLWAAPSTLETCFCSWAPLTGVLLSSVTSQSSWFTFCLTVSHGRWLPQQCIVESNQSGQPSLAGIVECVPENSQGGLNCHKLSGEGERDGTGMTLLCLWWTLCWWSYNTVFDCPPCDQELLLGTIKAMGRQSYLLSFPVTILLLCSVGLIHFFKIQEKGFGNLPKEPSKAVCYLWQWTVTYRKS